MAMIKIKNLTKKYGDNVIYQNFDMSIEKCKVTVILGESGSGKTTLLNVLANLTDYDGKVEGVNERPSIVFQSDRLLKNLSVKDNIKLVSPNLTDEQILQGLKDVGLENYADSYPKVLSGGMSRRVALLRAFSFNSEILLMDEPFSSLDLAWKIRLINGIKAGQNSSPKTVVIITHDIKEAVLVADRIVVLERGKITLDINKITDKTEEELFKFMAKI